ncbi:MAG: argininosuccinate lyase [Phycisphaerae bacterium]
MGKKSSKPDVEKSWQSRLSSQADADTARFLASLDVDHALWRYDIAGSIAHARMLRETGLITDDEFESISKGLHSIADDIERDRLDMPVELEDIHMVIEAALIQRVGPVGGKLHTGRSRNDQVALDLRLWARDAIDELCAAAKELQQAFVDLAEAQGKVVFPAYTHMQRAQPVLAGHVMLAYVEMLQRDADRLADCRRRVNVCPLGSGATAGTTLPLDRARTAELLGFPRYSRNSIDATSDRDFLAELCFDCALLEVHLSRWAEDWIVFSTVEFGLLELDDAYCTSSSMMPQKKNADTLELIRARSAGGIGRLAGMLTLLKGLPIGYSRDLQDDKRFAFAAVESCRSALSVATGVAATAKINEQRVAEGLDDGYLDATALAEYLVQKGVPFRQAHQVVGRLVARAEKEGKSLAQLPLETLQAAAGQVESDVSKYLGAANVVKRYAPDGSGGARQLRKQLNFWKRKLS